MQAFLTPQKKAEAKGMHKRMDASLSDTTKKAEAKGMHKRMGCKADGEDKTAAT